MTITLLPTHPILGCAATISAALDEVADVEPAYMSVEHKQAALARIAQEESRLAELRMRVMAASDDVAAEHGARDVAAWLAHQTRAEPRTVRADLELARELDRNCPQVAAAMRTGGVSPAQARVITAALDDLPDRVAPETRAAAEATLVAHCERFRPSELRRLGQRILDVVAPDVAEAEDAKKLAEEERRARQKAFLRFRPLGDGTTRVTGLLPDSVAARLRTYLEAYTSPRHRGTAGHPGAGDPNARRESSSQPHRPDDEAQDPGPYGVPPAERRPQPFAYAHAFGALLEHLDPQRLPEHGGDATTVMVTLDLEQLRTELATATLLDLDPGAGPNLTAAEARRLACTAKIVPVVLGTDSEILDIGRARRLVTPAQRRALRLRDKTCRAEGCTIPATWTEAHHRDPWSQGGATDLDNAVSLCSHHHHRIHDPHYRSDVLPDGDIRFHRRV